jgi:hypothetical protein
MRSTCATCVSCRIVKMSRLRASDDVTQQQDAGRFLSSATPRYVLAQQNPSISSQDLGPKWLVCGRLWLLLLDAVVDSGDFRLMAWTV